jgi:probable HAF family extracellular repeat protein
MSIGGRTMGSKKRVVCRSLVIVAAGGMGGLVALASGAGATTYNFVTLDVPNGNNAVAYGINDAGQIVGSFASNDGTGVHGFLYSGGAFTQIDVPGAGSTEAYGINNQTEIVGFYQTGSGQFGFADIGGSFNQIQFGPTYTMANGVNDSGAVVGDWNDTQGEHGFVLVNGNFTVLNAVAPQGSSRWTRAYGINNTGQISGTFFDGVGTHGFLYSAGTFGQIDAPGGSGSTQVTGINDSDSVVGFWSAGATHGFVDAAGTFSPIDVPGTNLTVPLGINHQGIVVGFFNGSDSTMHGFVATPVPAFAGTPGASNCFGQSVATLAIQFGGLDAAASASDYSDISALQNAIRAYCGSPGHLSP